MRIFMSILLFGFALIMSVKADAQESIAAMEKSVGDAVGFKRLEILYTLTTHYINVDERKARKYARQANLMADNFIDSNSDFTREEGILIYKSKLQFGEILLQRESYLDAQSSFEVSKQVASQFKYPLGVDRANNYLYLIDSLAAAGKVKSNFFNKALSDIDIGSAFSNSSNSMATSSELKLAQMAEKRGDTTTAIIHYKKASDLLRNRGQLSEAEKIDDKILTYREINRVDSIRAQLTAEYNNSGPAESSEHRIEIDSTGGLVLVKVDTTYAMQNKDELDQLKLMALKSEESEDFEASLSYYKEFVLLQQKYQEDSALRVAAIKLANSEMDRLEQRNILANMSILAIQQEKDAEVLLKNILIVIAAIITLATVFILFMYWSKLKKNRQLTLAYADLDTAKGRIEEAERNISNLLNQQVSPEIASALIQDKPQREEQFVAVMFLDIRGFTPMAEKLNPEQLIDYQNKVFGFMIEIIRERHGNINQFMGDGFMATFGAPISHGNDIRNAYLAGVEILREIKERNEAKKIPRTLLGIGVHAGLVVTGNVGTESRKQYSVTGNTVIIAARVEQLNKVYGSQMIVTEEVYKHLTDKDLDITPERHEVKVKGREEPVNILIIDKEPEVIVS
jgi:class 3 adenylate cyclase